MILMDGYEERLNYYIEIEKNGEFIDFTVEDTKLFNELCEIINDKLNVVVHFIAQLDIYHYFGSGKSNRWLYW